MFRRDDTENGVTVSTTTNQQTFGGNGSTVVFTFSFIGVSAQYLSLIFTDADGAQTTVPPAQYLISINPVLPNEIWGAGGTVTYPLIGAPILAGTTLTLTRILPLTQEISISNQGNFYPQTVETIDDLLEMQVQQVSARTGQIRGTWLSGVQYNFGDIVTDGVNGNDTGNLYACAIPNISNVWSTDLASGIWSLALNVQGIVNALPTIPNNNVFANISGGTATPVGVGVSALLDSTLGNVQGSLLYRAGALWTVLTPGTNGQVLSTQGPSANPQWITNSAGGGTITGVTAGAGLTGGGVTGNVTLSVDTVANGAVMANLSGATATPIGTTISAILDATLGSSQGDILYRSGTTWAVLTPASGGFLLQTNGAGNNPQWTAVLANGFTATTQAASDNSTKVATTAQVQAAIAAAGFPLMTPLGVGSIVVGTITGNITTGGTIAGTSISCKVMNPTGTWNVVGPALSGTWQALISNQASANGTLFQRIS